MSAFVPVLSRPHPAGRPMFPSAFMPDVGPGSQEIYRFPNGYGASVVFFYGSYGAENGLKELAVVKFIGESTEQFELTYETPITDDVMGHLTSEEVEMVLKQISELPSAESA